MPNARLMDGSSVAKAIVEDVTSRAAEFTAQAKRRPCLAAVLVGDDPGSRTYVKMKQNRCKSAGMESRLVQLPGSTTTDELVNVIKDLSADETVDGILLQHPVPSQIDERLAFEAISPSKDVDGVTMYSFSSMAMGTNGFRSCTPEGIVRLLDAYEVALTGKHAVVIGRSPILGKPVGMLLLSRDATVTYCHSRTTDLAEVVRTADIVVAAVGKAELVTGDMLKNGSVVLDAGYNAKNVGDVAFEEASQIASLITPVPGGVGPMTIAVLLDQTVSAAATQHGISLRSVALPTARALGL